MQVQGRWRSMAASPRTRRRSSMWRPCWTPTGATRARLKRSLCAGLMCAAAALTAPARALADPSPSQILALHAQVMHRSAVTAGPGGTEIRGRIDSGGLTGTFTDDRLGLESRSELDLGPIVDLTVDDGTHIWKSDENGDVWELTGVLRARSLTARSIAFEAYATDPAQAEYAGRADSQGRPCYAFYVRAPGGDRQRICIDAKSYLLDSHEFDDGDQPATLTFSDYRTVDGVPLALRVREAFAYSKHALVFTVEHVRENVALAPSLFARPPARSIELQARRVVVPMRRTHSGYEVPVQIAGHAYWFLLDSGTQGIVVDRSVAAAAGVAVTGQLRAVGARAIDGLGMARLATLAVGGATLRDVTVGVLDFSSVSGGTFAAAGVLGFPFFDAAVVRMDSHALTLEISAPGDIGASGGGERLAVQLDRRVPVVEGGLDGQSRRDSFLIDTGSSAELLLYQRFARAHPDIVSLVTPARTGSALGGTLTLHDATLAQLTLGSVALYNVRATVVLAERGAFADPYDAGSVGMGILRGFVVTFDEPAGALYLQRGADFDDGRFRPEYDPSGLPPIR
ncbi:hypothetical protein EPN52_00060 [bacterium]|nr:MAG: hypothetical protein EPN52_00060 [bacterium]